MKFLSTLLNLWLLGSATHALPFNNGTTSPRSAGQPHGGYWNNYGATSLDPFNVVKIAFGQDYYKFVDDPTGAEGQVLRVFYPEGSATPSSAIRGGFGFYAEPLKIDQEATLEYKVYFPPGFDFVKGGKLPGLYGGIDTCPDSTSRECLTSRFMWRQLGDGELYTYFPLDQDPEYCQLPPKTVCNAQYGDSLARGSFRLNTGKWHTVRQSLRLNDVGKRNGFIKTWANGKLVINYDKAVLRTEDGAKLIGLVFHTFFGGSDPSYRTPVDQYSYFKEFKMYNRVK